MRMPRSRIANCACCGSATRHCCCKSGGGPSGGGAPSGGGGTPPWTPQPQGSYLLIQYDAADTGVRPVPSGDVWWLSPDIWVTGGDGLGNPIAGQPCQVNARIWNSSGQLAQYRPRSVSPTSSPAWRSR